MGRFFIQTIQAILKSCFFFKFFFFSAMIIIGISVLFKFALQLFAVADEDDSDT
jgi:hypothetical protein